MKRIDFLTLFLPLLLVAGIAGAVAATVAQGGPRLLLRAGDLKERGTEYVSAAEGPCAPRSGPGEMTGWTEGRSMAVSVTSPADREVGLVGSASFHYSSAIEARQALEKVQDPGTAYGLHTLGEAKAVTDADVLKLLQAHTGLWRAWYGFDEEGMPGYLLRFQAGSDVAELQVHVLPGQEVFGRLLLNDAARALLRPSLLEYLNRLRRK